MSAARKIGMLLASVFALLAFCWQANACLAEHASLLPCHEEAGESSAEDDLGEGHCCHVESNAALGHGLPVAFRIFQEVGYSSRPFGAPDGPIREIEYPPQVLS